MASRRWKQWHWRRFSPCFDSAPEWQHSTWHLPRISRDSRDKYEIREISHEFIRATARLFTRLPSCVHRQISLFANGRSVQTSSVLPSPRSKGFFSPALTTWQYQRGVIKRSILWKTTVRGKHEFPFISRKMPLFFLFVHEINFVNEFLRNSSNYQLIRFQKIFGTLCWIAFTSKI